MLQIGKIRNAIFFLRLHPTELNTALKFVEMHMLPSITYTHVKRAMISVCPQPLFPMKEITEKQHLAKQISQSHFVNS